MRPGTILLTVMLAACNRAGDPGPAGDVTAGDPEVISRVTEEGPVEATVSLWPAQPRLGDPLSLRLTVESQAGVAVEMPAFGEALGRFSILDFVPRRQTRPDGVAIASQQYTLQAPMSGKQRIPPLRIEYLDARPGQPDSGDEYRELLSEELSVDVASVLPEGQIIDELRPARPPLAELRGGFLARSWIWLLAGAAALVGFGWALLVWQRRAAERLRLTAYDRAIARLEKLERLGLPSAETADVWYVELSDIVRRYIEDQHGLRAPELTTEEFLKEARGSEELSTAQRELLPAFLEGCDRVKFAAYSPQQDESKQALTLARRFLAERPQVAEPAPETTAREAA